MSDETIQNMATLAFERRRFLLSLKDIAEASDADDHGSLMCAIQAAQALIAEIEATGKAA